jgi:hypothetical protein
LFYSITVAGFVNAKNVIYAQIVLTFGALIVSLLALVLRRSQQKLNHILDDDLFKDKSHPAKIIDDLAVGKIGSKRGYIGIVIPTICSLILIIGAIIHLVYIIFFYYSLTCYHP